MKQQNPSNRATVELNHEHIATLRAVADDVEIDRALGPVHEKYLAGEYPKTEFGHALVDDLALSASQIAELDAQLRASVDEYPIDVIEHLTGELDYYDQIAYRQPTVTSCNNDDDDDIIVADGGIDQVSNDQWQCPHCGELAEAPDSTGPHIVGRERRGVELRVTCPHCNKIDEVEVY